MEKFTDRTQMMFTAEGIEKLKNCRIAVFGIGGVGSFVCEALARAGIGCLDITDNDKVTVSNINRQLVALESTIGQYKADVMKSRILDINPDCKVRAFKTVFLPETQDQFDFTEYDYVVDAIDTVTGKLAIIEKANAAGVPVMSSMGAGNKINASLFEVADIYDTSVCPLAKVMRHECKKRGIKHLKVVYSREKPIRPIEDMSISCRTNCVCPPGTARKCTEKRDIPGSTAFAPSVAGLIIAGEVINDLTGKKSIKG